MDPVPFQILPRYLEGQKQPIFVVEYIPEGQAASHTLVVPPFSEELNRSRHMLSYQARRLASLGHRVVMPDLSGTGDSYGQFSDANWSGWLEDIEHTVASCSFPEGHVDNLLSLRAGALLASEAIVAGNLNASRLILWGPCLSGEQVMSQFLRLRTLSSIIGLGQHRENLAMLKSALEKDRFLEVSGYVLNIDLYNSFVSRKLGDTLHHIECPVYWFEMVSESNDPVPRAARLLVEKLKREQKKVTLCAVSGPRFWETTEISKSEQLATRTTELISGQ